MRHLHAFLLIALAPIVAYAAVWTAALVVLGIVWLVQALTGH